MNLYKISQDANNDYDTYDSAVVAAETEEAARTISPSPYRRWTVQGWVFSYSDGRTSLEPSSRFWADPEFVKVELIGTAKDGTESGVICASFNAG